MNNLSKINNLLQDLQNELKTHFENISKEEIILSKKDIKNIKLVGKEKGSNVWWNFEYLGYVKFNLCINEKFSARAEYLSEIYNKLENGTLDRLILIRTSKEESVFNYSIEEEINTKIRDSY
jgi:hypothetical protein